MKSRNSVSRRQRQALLAHCDEIGIDDCVDPNDYFQSDRTTRKSNRKSLQLCRQVARCLELVLGDCDEPEMGCLSIATVVPAPDTSRLLVTCFVTCERGEFSRQGILSKLQNQSARLRSEIAHSIHRKRVPQLAFEVIPCEHATEVDGDE